MIKRRAIGLALVMLTLFNASTALAQQTSLPQGLRDEDVPSLFRELILGTLWGQLFIGAAEADDKETFEDVEVEFARSLGRAIKAEGHRQTPGLGAGTNGSARRLGYQLVGAFDIAHYGFGNGFGGFSVISALGGVRVLPKPGKKIWPYGEFLAGLQHSFGENAFAISPRAGVIFPLGKFFLSAQGGFETALYSGASDTGLRARVGLTLPLGSKN